MVENGAIVIIRPKTKQNANETKCNISKPINPIDSNITLAGIKNARDRGIIISCSNSNTCDKFKDLANNMLSNKYDVKEVASLHPRIKIVGISEKLGNNILTSYIKNQNKSSFSDAS